MKKPKVIKAWAVVNDCNPLDDPSFAPTSTFAHMKVGEEIETAYHFELYWREEEARKRKAWINKPDQKYYKILPVEIRILPSRKSAKPRRKPKA
jgi:hypothetical protein